jgi:hypothetical protein
MRLNLVLVFLTVGLLLPASVSAQQVVEYRMGPVTSRCQGATSKKHTKKIEKWQPELGGANTRKAWKTLIDQAEEGCDIVAEWLAAGAQGEMAAGIGDAAEQLIEGGNLKHGDAALTMLAFEDVMVVKQIITGLEKRLAVLDPETTMALARDERPGVAAWAMPVFIGYHSEGAMEFIYGVPVWKETAYWGSTTAPPDHYVAAVADIYERLDMATMVTVAKFCGRHFKEGHADNDVWAQFLVPLVGAAAGSEKDEQDAANRAANTLAWGEPAGIDEAIAAVLASGNETTLDHMLNGFEDKLDDGRGTLDTVARLATIMAGGEKGQFKRAEKLHKKWSRKIK